MSEEVATGPAGTIRFTAARCIHARNCVLDRPDVFVPNVAGTWIHPERASAGELAALARNCPSGAIAFEPAEGPGEAPPLVNTLRIRENGPYAVHADLRIAGAPESRRAVLCRCGASANKPYCDSSHAQRGFSATGEPAIASSAPLAARDGALAATPLPNGPLRLAGNLEIVSGTGHTVNRVTETFLCRCGESRNKPYCDGSHVAAGFKG